MRAGRTSPSRKGTAAGTAVRRATWSRARARFQAKARARECSQFWGSWIEGPWSAAWKDRREELPPPDTLPDTGDPSNPGRALHPSAGGRELIPRALAPRPASAVLLSGAVELRSQAPHLRFRSRPGLRLAVGTQALLWHLPHLRPACVTS